MNYGQFLNMIPEATLVAILIILFIADFACLPKRLIIELDGGYHQLPDQQVSDAERTNWLEQQGFKVIRFSNEEVIGDIEHVLSIIKEHLK